MKKEIDPDSIAQYIHRGDSVRIKTDKLIVTMEVIGYESGKYIVGKDQFTGDDVRISFQEIQEIRAESSLAGTSSKVAEYAPYAIYIPFIPLVITAPLFDSEDEVAKQQRDQERTIRDILYAEKLKFDRMTTEQVQAELGAPKIKYSCMHNDGPYYTLVWAYNDERMPEGMKYLSFTPISQELSWISSTLRYGCLEFTGDDKGLLPAPEEIAAHDAEVGASHAIQELKYIEYAKNALSEGNTEAAYRLIEDGIVSEELSVRGGFKHFLLQHPELQQGAIQSFTLESFRESKKMYGDTARDIEKRRLSIYKTIAPDGDYQNARANYESVFGSDD